MLEVEALSTWQDRNTAQVPNDATGTRFSIADLTGSGPNAGLRVTYTRALGPKQELVAVIAPLSVSGTGELPGPTLFQGRNFAAGTPTTADYRFDTYRVAWRYRVVERPDWNLRVGLTGLIRDARIALSQDGTSAEKTNVGFVPLLHLYGEWRLAQRLSLVGDLDGLAGGPGRAIDLGLRLRYELTPTWSLAAGWRMLDGGVDNDEQYNFARFHSLSLGISARF